MTTAVTFGGIAAASFTVNSLTSDHRDDPRAQRRCRGCGGHDRRGTGTASVGLYLYNGPDCDRGFSEQGLDGWRHSRQHYGSEFHRRDRGEFWRRHRDRCTVNSATSITATSPAGSAGTVDVTVTTPNGTSATSAADHFTYVIPADRHFDLADQRSTAGGTSVTITGTNFTGATAVNSAQQRLRSRSTAPAQITANSPAASGGNVDVTVTTPGGTSATSAADQFSYGLSPTWVSVSSSNGTNTGSCPNRRRA